MKRIILTFTAFLALLAAAMPRPSLAEHIVVLNGDVFKNTVDLSRLFEKNVQLQKGQTCHIHSAVDLMQALCKRRTGKNIQLSRAYFIYRHLTTKLRGLSSFSPSDPGYKNAPFFNEVDRGDCYKSLERFINQSVCTEKVMPLDKDFLQLFENIKETQMAVEDANRISCQRLDDYFSCKMEAQGIETKPNHEGGLQTAKLDPELKKCFEEPMIIKYENYSLKRALDLLTLGIPFACDGPWVLANGVTTEHSVVVVGYRVNQKFAHDSRYPLGIEWKVRDSDNPKSAANWGFHLGCRKIVYIN